MTIFIPLPVCHRFQEAASSIFLSVSTIFLIYFAKAGKIADICISFDKNSKARPASLHQNAAFLCSIFFTTMQQLQCHTQRESRWPMESIP
jgi:hypothetical protein